MSVRLHFDWACQIRPIKTHRCNSLFLGIPAGKLYVLCRPFVRVVVDEVNEAQMRRRLFQSVGDQMIGPFDLHGCFTISRPCDSLEELPRVGGILPISIVNFEVCAEFGQRSGET